LFSYPKPPYSLSPFYFNILLNKKGNAADLFLNVFFSSLVYDTIGLLQNRHLVYYIEKSPQYGEI